jgi:hypothetical protein
MGSPLTLSAEPAYRSGRPGGAAIIDSKRHTAGRQKIKVNKTGPQRLYYDGGAYAEENITGDCPALH